MKSFRTRTMSAAAAEVPIVAGVHHVVDAHLWGLGIILELLGTIFNVAGKQCIRLAQTSGKIAFWFGGRNALERRIPSLRYLRS